MLLGKKINRKKNKSKSKRQRTFTSSEFSLPEERNFLSTSELFRNDALKRKMAQPSGPKKNKSLKQLQATKKRPKSKSKVRLDKCQTYEMIPYKNSLNSQIVFSNEDTRRDGVPDQRITEQLAIKVNHQYLVDSNRQLRISIKKEYKKKVEAAIKIQKVFRGFLTRKILQKYVQFQHKILTEKLAQHRQESVSQHSSYFAEKENRQQRRKVQIEQLGVFEYSNPREKNQTDQNLQNQEDSQEQMQHVVYRHHEPIYSHDEISGYLQSSEEQDFDQDAFDNHIIFETNEEYIDSRKSSLHQQPPKNKLSKAGHPDTINEEPPETPTNTNAMEQYDFSKTEKKQGDRMKIKMEQQQVKDQTMKMTDQTDKSHPPIPQFLQNAQYDATIKESEVNMKKKEQKQYDSDHYHLNALKETQLSKWEEIIGLVQSQINKTMINNIELSNFMKQIMEISIKNKQMLEIHTNNIDHRPLHSDKSLSRLTSLEKLKQIKASRQYLTHLDLDHQLDNRQALTNSQSKHLETLFDKPLQPPPRLQIKKQAITLTVNALFFNEEDSTTKKQKIDQRSNSAANPLSPISSLDCTGQMKKFLSGNIQDEHIDEMLKLRQDLMKKRQTEQIRKLNTSIENKTLSQEQFLNCLQNISRKYTQEKNTIEKAKQDIQRGYHAALKLTKQTFSDAKKLGYKMTVSRSVEGIKYKTPLIFSEVIIDQMMQLTHQQGKNIKGKNQKQSQSNKNQHAHKNHGDSCSDQSSDLQFTQDQMKRFRRAQPYDIQFAEQIADLGKNVMISEQLLRQQLMEDTQDNDLMKTQHVFRQIYEIQEGSPHHHKNDPKVDLITQKIVEWITWELSGQLLIKPLFSEKLMDKNHFYRPKPVSDKERLRFISLLKSFFPSVEQLNLKLNQKICPLPTQLLRCMRIDFTDDQEDDNSYEQIGKYEFIIGQEVCNQAIHIFRQEIDSQTPTCRPSLSEIEQLVRQYNINERVVKYVQQRQKYISNRKNHTKQLRWEVLNIQIHCIFDAWNEELIYLRSHKVGYSGIGLNELTLSVKDNNCQVEVDQTIKIIGEGKKRLINNLSLSSPGILFPLLVQQDDDQLLDKDSKWIFYADEALSYGLQLVYLIEEQVFTEMAKQLRKKMLQFG